jgi:hypothetical protein
MLSETAQRWVARTITGELTVDLRRANDSILDTRYKLLYADRFIEAFCIKWTSGIASRRSREPKI